jgi:SAM-dependent methyltransferase
MTIVDADGPNADQRAFWNTAAGTRWVLMQEALDGELRLLGLAAIDALAPVAGQRLIDIGCGCGDTSFELARRVGLSGSVVGIDLSAPMLEAARRRAAALEPGRTRFVQADAQTYAFEPADGAFSRFGVMFFADPVAAFINIRKSLRPKGRLAFVCWQSMANNPWMEIPLNAAISALPTRPAPRDPAAPGPFAFADRTRVQAILAEAGFSDVVITPHNQRIGWPDLDVATRTALTHSPLAAIQHDHPHLHDRIGKAVRAALAAYSDEQGVFLPSATWIVVAHNR